MSKINHGALMIKRFFGGFYLFADLSFEIQIENQRNQYLQ